MGISQNRVILAVLAQFSINEWQFDLASLYRMTSVEVHHFDVGENIPWSIVVAGQS